jgi:hypothetical protein
MLEWVPALEKPLAAAQDIYEHISSTWILLQLGAIGIALGLAWLLSHRVSRGIENLAEGSRHGSFLRR